MWSTCPRRVLRRRSYVILGKFAGREATLLGKVRAKYVDVDVSW